MSRGSIPPSFHPTRWNELKDYYHKLNDFIVQKDTQIIHSLQADCSDLSDFGKVIFFITLKIGHLLLHYYLFSFYW